MRISAAIALREWASVIVRIGEVVREERVVWHKEVAASPSHHREFHLTVTQCLMRRFTLTA